MKKHHILNIGYPKCGTTWCYAVIAQQPWFNMTREKENKDLLKGVSVNKYSNSYIHNDITANFAPGNVALDQYIIQQLSEIPTVSASIILRNPYDLYFSLYNYMKDYRLDYNAYVRNLVDQSWFHRPEHVIKRWQKCFTQERFQIFFYQDLKENSNQFLLDYCDRMGLPEPTILHVDKINVTKYIHNNTNLDADLVTVINNEIDKLQLLVSRDLSDWKKYD
jgi:hypothetical protein